jgi:hypothetical protein
MWRKSSVWLGNGTKRPSFQTQKRYRKTLLFGKGHVDADECVHVERPLLRGLDLDQRLGFLLGHA